MRVYTKLADDVNEVDVIIAGGGTAACVIAGRLAEADPSLSILVIERGQDNRGVQNIENPVFFLDHLLPTSTTAIFYQGNKAGQLAGREFIVPSGGTLGGGYRGEKGVHGHDGPVHVSDGTFRSEYSENEFIKAAAQVGWPEIKDLQTLDAINGVERWLRTVSKDGKRQDTARVYLHDKLNGSDYPNLHVLTESKVVRVLLDGQKRAVGVEYTPNPEFQAAVGPTQHPKLTVKARKLAVVSCGACGTPPVLERSGLGDPEILKRAGVPVTVNLPGKPGGPSGVDQQEGQSLVWNSIDISSKLRPTEADVAALGPDFHAAWDRDFKNALDRPLTLMGLVSCFLGDSSTVPEAQYLTVGNYTAYPYSRGHVHITGPEVDDPQDFDVGYLNDAHDIDLKKQLWAYKKQRAIMRRTAMYRGEVAAGHPRFPAGSAAACVDLDEPLRDVQDLEYSAEDDKAIEQWIRENVGTTWHSIGTTWHSIGTTKMAPREEFGVVDQHLNVWGTKGLKVADLSIPPMNVGANANNTAMVVGEKAADIIKKELGLKS
ncbi:hypothetical protein BGZ61DRAFT_485491 [Ilyonectria robusta]|uniref:uncharacterized protein n=1 Tax=Ilyonectria robusta TaxID=1079257 RepID=UPI001E8DEC42|nr:uncharacterized protein BGZ61DRAFT_485491 [Ilyonectria robusta]KAH8661137.1 hypothetical protein BGZ61DRAFT_485491 [Ilyonectria robusta]